MKVIFSFLLILLGLGVSSCAAPTAHTPSTSYYDNKKIRQSHLKYEMSYQKKRDKRIQSVFYKVKATTGEELCDRKLRPDLGIGYGVYKRKSNSIWATQQDKQEDEDMFEMMPYARDDTIYVRFIVPGSAADKAGIKENDAIVAIFGAATPLGTDNLDKFNEVLEKNLSNANLEMPIDLVIDREGKQISLQITPDKVCPYDLVIDKSYHGINAYSDGEKVALSEEIIDYLTEDNDLAGVLSHELAHNTLGHSSSKSINAATGAVVGAVVDAFLDTDGAATAAGLDLGSQMYSKDFESEADYVSVYYMARSGYNYKTVGALQKKLAARDKASLYADGITHPQPQNRYALLKETAHEIDMKKSFSEEILPDFKVRNSHLQDKRD